ncbi:(2Fe-2S)-binding protein [Sphingosinicella rhizophila]|uniref:(2Fe-2S)-binding protein n=1 Tax=Sphingosinicella rhizophila TaxID=3050082 RepID=A0ABU3Q770_9SPHN|nr:2Fe-2S iron-sulfur cluster-binding protein [Sphingosinicella sp. GR2756]MDT9598795.1 (2Fe-2S)-binding protein [Sphingosinicella sp. GR2756]
MTVTISCTVNGRQVVLETEPTSRLSDMLRDDLLLTGTNIGCEEGVCGACTVLVDGKSARSCLLLAAQCEGAAIETVEGLRDAGAPPTPAQAALHRHDAFQCGYCTSGFLMVIEEMMRANRVAPLAQAEVDDRLTSVLCRCTGYLPIRRAVRTLLDGDR